MAEAFSHAWENRKFNRSSERRVNLGDLEVDRKTLLNGPH